MKLEAISSRGGPGAESARPPALALPALVVGAGLVALGVSVGCGPVAEEHGASEPPSVSLCGGGGGGPGGVSLGAAVGGSTPAGRAGEVLETAVEDAYAAAVAGAEGDSYLMEATGVEFVPIEPERFARVVGALREWAVEIPRGVARWLAQNPDTEVVNRLVGEVVWALSDGDVAAGGDGARAAERLIDAIDDTDQWTVAVWAYTRQLAESFPAEEAVERLARLERIQIGRAVQMVGIENSRIDAGIVPEHAMR